MDDTWEHEANGRAPSFQEFLAAGDIERQRFLDGYIASRGLSADATNREMLLSFLNRSGTPWIDSPAQAERLLDAFIRVRPEQVIRSRGKPYDHTA